MQELAISTPITSSLFPELAYLLAFTLRLRRTRMISGTTSSLTGLPILVMWLWVSCL